MLKLTFLGAAGTVTGSRFLIESASARVLVDCGLFQGLKRLRKKNWRPPPVDPAKIDAVVLTHAHLDHSGYLPVLVRLGFAGPVYATESTRDLAGILLPDSGHIQEEDARYADRKQFSKHKPAKPLYTEAEGRAAASRIESVELGEDLRVGDLKLRLSRAGHILGAASVSVRRDDVSILFSGDLGRPDDLLMRPPTAPAAPDYVVMESTYGDREHRACDPVDALREVVAPVVDRGGVVLIPAFAVGRAQLMLYCLHQLFARGDVPRVPVYVNSPMATNVTRLYQRHSKDHRLSEAECAEVCATAEYVASVEESRRLNEKDGPMIIISASGMLTGGRILHHLKRFAPSPRNAIVLPGYQASGTRGDSLLRGAEELKIHGSYVPVRAEVHHLDVYSAHADQKGLLAWLGACTRAPRGVFLVHGEPAAADTLRRRIDESLGFPVDVAEDGQSVEL